MKIMQNIRIKNKLILIIVIIGTISSLTGNLINYFYELHQTRNRLVSDTQMHARLISEYCKLPLEFNYPEKASEVLQKLSSIDQIEDGVLFTSRDSIFAEFHRSSNVRISIPPQLKQADFLIQGNYLHTKQVISSIPDGGGYIYIRSRVDWQEIIIRQLLISLGLTLLMVLLILTLAFYFQRSISEPIILLTDQMQKIAQSNQYNPIAPYSAKDEIGELYNGFNLMIDTIKTREDEKRKAMDELQISEKQYQNLYENAPVMYISVDASTGKISRCNKTLCQVTGYLKEELIGMEVFNMYHPDCQEKIREAFRQFKLTGTVVNQEFKIINKDGDILEITLDATAEYNDEGQILYSRSVWRDITKQKQAQRAEKIASLETIRLLEVAERSRRALLSIAEDQIRAKDEIQKLNESLEKRVLDRTAQLEAANRELESFSYSVSHDLRAPLRHISGFADMLATESKDRLSEKGNHYLSTIRSSAAKMGILIDDLLSFSRTGRAEMKKSHFNFRQVVDEAIVQLSLSLHEQKVEWSVGEMPDVLADINLMQLVVLNLLENALKYSRKRDKSLVIIACDDSSDEFVFRITDNGVGFDMQYASKLFGVFQRLHSSVEFEGTGIGLANVRRIIQRHGGRTWAESKINQGTTIYFTLPK